MKVRTLHRIREALRRNTDGMTAHELADETGARLYSVKSALQTMPDTYIDRWTVAGYRSPSQAVYCVVVPPPDCPRPQGKTK